MAEQRRNALVIPESMQPEQGIVEVVGQDGATYLLRNDAMFTGVRHSQAEFSRFFLALRDDRRIVGHLCPSCGDVIVPPFMRRCPPCNFVEMEEVEVRDVGTMAARPVIVMFAPSRFKEDVPFGLGRVFLDLYPHTEKPRAEARGGMVVKREANHRFRRSEGYGVGVYDGRQTATALFVRVRTTQGAIRPGIFRTPHEPVKIVFADNRRGEMRDIFAVPEYELTVSQIAKSPLFESDLDWSGAADIDLGEATPKARRALEQTLKCFQDLCVFVAESERAKKDLANWKRRVLVRTNGGAFCFTISDGELGVGEGIHPAPDCVTADLVLTVPDVSVLLLWARDAIRPPGEDLQSPPLTDLVMEGAVILSKNEMETITRLDRLPRSLRRDRAS